MPRRSAKPQLPPLSEAEFLRQVLRLARLYGWRTAHFRPAQARTGRWITAVQGDGKGFPDLVLVKDSRVLFVELKTERGRLSAEQALWLAALQAAGLTACVWTPANWSEIEAILTA